MQAQAPTHKYTVPYIALVAIFLLGFAILSYQLDLTSLWADEGWTINATEESNPVVTVRDWVADDVHPPLFFIGLDGWRVFVDDGIFELRYYSVLLSMLGMAVAFRLGQAMYSTRAGVLMALFYGLHDLVKVLTQEVRHYPQQLLLVTLAMWMYWRFYQKPTRTRGIVFVVSGVALLYTHYWGGFVLLGLALHALITRRKQLKPFIYVYAGMILLYLPWIPVLIGQITLERPGGLPHALENSQVVYATLVFQLIGIPELFWVVLMFAGGVGTFYALNRSTSWRDMLPSAKSLAPILVIVITPLLSVALNTVYPTLSFRSLAVIVPPVMLLSAYGLSRFRNPEQLFLIAFIVLYSLSKTSAGPIPRAPWVDVAHYMTQHATTNDVILLEMDTDVDPVSYYIRTSGNDVDYEFTERVRETQPDDYDDYLQSALVGHDGLWVGFLGYTDVDGDIRLALREMGYEDSAPIVDYGVYSIEGQINVWRMDRRPESDPIAIYGDVLTLLSADASTQETGVTINMLWSPTQVPEHDYTVSAFMRGTDGTFRNHDSAPLEGASSTLTWQADGMYFDSHFIASDGLPAGEYQVGVAIYSFTDSSYTTIENLLASDCDDDPECRFVIVDTVVIE